MSYLDIGGWIKRYKHALIVKCSSNTAPASIGKVFRSSIEKRFWVIELWGISFLMSIHSLDSTKHQWYQTINRTCNTTFGRSDNAVS